MREGYKDSLVGMIPEDWDVVKLGDVAELIMSNVDKKNHSHEKEVLLCNYLDVYENEYIKDSLNFLSATASDVEIEKFLIKKGDVIVTKDSETKEDIAHASAVVQDFENTLCGYHLALIRPTERNFNNIFLSKLFSINLIHKELVNKANGTTRYGLTVGTFEQLLIPFPKVSEQSKIASILSTVDEKIDAINERIAQTKQLKSGLMQRLLTKGIGHKRFKESPLGEIPENWEVVSFTEVIRRRIISEIQDGNHGESHPKSTDYINEGIPFIMANCITQRNQLNLTVAKKISEKKYNSLRIGFTKSGDILLTHKGTVGLTAVVNESHGKLMLTPQVTYYRISNTDVLSNIYLYYYFQSQTFQIILEKFAKQSTRAYIGISAQKKLPLILPKEIDEQKHIASILTTIDDKLDLLQEKKTLYNHVKQGLMRSLLTGNIRVKA